ncbi:hypothetical protein K1T35_30155 [Pseudonocardia sp. DSM 110487]|uniref:hypothetical protein n=1 Tax=Pseudonocardia sp. DSM 110487 TaxID=2865833 RepID=UPI001C69D4C1|nr:hypothetical protein [Pseudonocardia sp. DSM 110487]QYN32812.1 hypothetical protein K1T35_30155 [Pseudonocardia sp. DSM 110487]
MTGRARAGVLAACAVVVLLAAWYAGAQVPASVPAPVTGSVRLGPEPGEEVAAYLQRLPAELPAPGTAALALVQFTAELPASAAVPAVAGTTPVTAVLRVPMPRVQTALRFQPLEQGMPVPAALDAARRRAQEQAAADAQRQAGRAADVAAAEAMALADPATPCVLALVVQAERAGLDAMAARPDVRAVHAAPTGVTARELALSPLLPEQVEHADPLPDDGQPPS